MHKGNNFVHGTQNYFKTLISNNSCYNAGSGFGHEGVEAVDGEVAARDVFDDLPLIRVDARIHSILSVHYDINTL